MLEMGQGIYLIHAFNMSAYTEYRISIICDLGEIRDF